MDGQGIELQIHFARKIHQHSFFGSMTWHREARSCPFKFRYRSDFDHFYTSKSGGL
jgi:hypothetical protein